MPKLIFVSLSGPIQGRERERVGTDSGLADVCVTIRTYTMKRERERVGTDRSKADFCVIIRN